MPVGANYLCIHVYLLDEVLCEPIMFSCVSIAELYLDVLNKRTILNNCIEL